MGAKKIIYALYQTDNWHTQDSRVLFCIGESKEGCVEMLCQKYGSGQNKNDILCTNEMAKELLSNGQSQSSPGGWEFEIDTYQVGVMLE